MSTVAYRKPRSGLSSALLMLPVVMALTHPGLGDGIANAARQAIRSGVESAMPAQGFGGNVFASNTVGGTSPVFVSGGPIYLR